MISQIQEMLSYGFIQKSLVVGLFLAIASALVGVPLVLRRKSMLSDGLSHVSFGSVAIALFLGIAPTGFTIAAAIIIALLIIRNNESKNNSDSQIAIVSASALAIGMVFLSLIKNNSTDPNNYLFGSLLAITNSDLILSIIVGLATIVLYLIFYKQIFAISFDEEFAMAIGVNAKMYDIIFAIICAAVVVLGMKISGALLISAFIVFPCLSAMRIAKSFKSVVFVSVIFAIISFLIGFVASYLLETPVGATIAISELVVYILSLIVAKIK